MSVCVRQRASCSARVLGLLVPILLGSWAEFASASCENYIEVRGPGFEYHYNDTEPYADKPIGTDAVSDSLYDESVARLYERLARGLAVAAHIHHTLQPKPANTKQARSGEVLRLWEAPTRGLRRYVPDGGTPTARPDTLVDRLRQGAIDSTAVLYTVQIGSFVEKTNARARVRLLQDLIQPQAPWDSTRIVEWRNSACGNGSRRPDLFVLAPDEAAGVGYKVMHGLFIDRRDANQALTKVRVQFALPATVIPVRVTGRVLHAAIRPSFRDEAAVSKRRIVR